MNEHQDMPVAAPMELTHKEELAVIVERVKRISKTAKDQSKIRLEIAADIIQSAKIYLD